MKLYQSEIDGGSTRCGRAALTLIDTSGEMSKHKEPLLEALKEGRSYTWTVPDGGDLASMRAAIKHGQTLTMSPIGNPCEIQVGDLVLVQWHKGTVLHLVGEIQGDQLLIVNSVGKINGWVSVNAILGRITQIVDPEPHPSLPQILERLEAAYRQLIEREQPVKEEARLLLSVVTDLYWYADRLGIERWDKMPRQNKWSFEQNVWHLTKQAENAATSAPSKPVRYWIDQGKVCIGLAADIVALFESSEAK